MTCGFGAATAVDADLLKYPVLNFLQTVTRDSSPELWAGSGSRGASAPDCPVSRRTHRIRSRIRYGGQLRNDTLSLIY